MFAIVYGSVREGRLGIRAARFFTDFIAQRGIEAELVDPLDFDLGLLKKRYMDYKAGDTVPEALQRLRAIMVRARAYVMVTAEYNASLPPALSNLIDHFGPDEFAQKPVGIVSYSQGRYGGTRSSQQLRTIMPQLGAITVPYAVAIPTVDKQFDENGVPLADVWPGEAGKLVDQLEFWSSRAGAKA